MKIAIYVPSWPPGSSANGIATYASYLVPALRARGHEVFVLTPRKMPEDNDRYTVDLRRFAPRMTWWHRAEARILPDHALYRQFTFGLVSAIKELATRYQIDVVEIEESFGWSAAVSRLDLLPVIVRLHGPWFLMRRFNGSDHALSTRRATLEGRGIQHASFVTAPSVEVLTAVKKYYGLSLAASRAIANPISLGDAATLWDIGTCISNTILFVGRFNVLKGGDLVLRAFAEVAQSHPKVRLTFIGPDDGIVGIDGNTVLFQDFVRNNIPEIYRTRIDFRGPLNHSDVMLHRRTHFATIIASQYETFSYSALEAFSLGCPIVATNVGGIPEIIEDRRNGLIVQSQDVKGMANALRNLLDNQSLAGQLGRKAWEDCRGRYEPGLIAEQTVAAYREALDSFKSRTKSLR